MPTDEAKLLLRMEVSQRKMERQLAAVNKKVNRSARNMETRFEKSAGRVAGSFAKMRGAGLAAFAGLVSVAALVNVSREIKEIIDQTSRLGKVSDKVGIDPETLQRIQFGFGQAGVAVSDMERNLEQWSKRASEAVQFGGRLADIFKANNVSLVDQNGNMRSSVDLLRDYANLIQGAGSAQERMTLATEAFGRSGGDMILALRNGAAGMDELMSRADKAGGVISNALVRSAEEIDDRFDAMSRSVGLTFDRLALNAADTASLIFDSFRSIENRGIATLNTQLQEIYNIRDEIKTRISKNESVGFSRDQLARDKNLLKKYTQQALKLRDIVDRRQGLSDNFVFNTPDRTKIKPAAPASRSSKSSKSSRSSSSSSKQVDELTRLIGLIKERTNAVLSETAAQAGVNPLINDYGFALEKARTEQELLSAAQQSGIAITPELRATISSLAEGYATATVEAQRLSEGQDSLRQSVENFKSAGKDLARGFIDDLRSGKTAAEALSGTLEKLADKLLDVALNAAFSGVGFGGGNIGGSILGSIFGGAKFGGAFANGGNLGAGQWGIAGEAGPEIIHGPANITPISKIGGAQNIHVTVGVSADGNGNISPFVESVARRESALAAGSVAGAVPAMVDARNNERQIRRIRPSR